ncbi:MAG: MotA/TolQ/ExbB proton channel family protein [Candidatus Firestonebacteria bacterium]|nr:MotA/TolQ/ExbB proton channel family protein [Candidatus Firestonebacteria bacterium]
MEIEFLQKGGIVMYPILVCSVFSLAIILERFYAYWKTNKLSKEFLSKVNILIKSDKINEAIEECVKINTPVSAVYKAGLLNRHKERDELKSITEEVASIEVSNLEKYLPGLATISTVTPLMGLLGTVTGMVTSFNAIAASTGVGESALLAKGIAEALLTTVFGLSVAIPSVIAYNYFSKKVDNIVLSIDRSSMELVDILVEMNSRVIDDLMKSSKES